MEHGRKLMNEDPPKRIPKQGQRKIFVKENQHTKLEEKTYSYLRAAGTEYHVAEYTTNK